MAETTVKTPTKKAATKTAVASAKPAEKKSAASKVADSQPLEKKPAAKAAPKTKPDTAKTDAVKKPSAMKTVSSKAAVKIAASKGIFVTDEQRYRMVAEAAYYRAESNQFKSDPLRDWIEAENDIAALLSARK